MPSHWITSKLESSLHPYLSRTLHKAEPRHSILWEVLRFCPPAGTTCLYGIPYVATKGSIKINLRPVDDEKSEMGDMHMYLDDRMGAGWYIHFMPWNLKLEAHNRSLWFFCSKNTKAFYRFNKSWLSMEEVTVLLGELGFVSSTGLYNFFFFSLGCTWQRFPLCAGLPMQIPTVSADTRIVCSLSPIYSSTSPLRSCWSSTQVSGQHSSLGNPRGLKRLPSFPGNSDA